MATGRVTGGHFVGATVSTGIGSALVVQSGLKWRRLSAEKVSQWKELPIDGNPVSAVGKAVAGVVVPRIFSKSASNAVGAALDATIKPSHIVCVDWTDGKRSLLKLPDDLFTHFALMLQDCRAPESESAGAEVVGTGTDTTNPTQTVAGQALSLMSKMVTDKLPKMAGSESGGDRVPEETDVVAQISRLADLHEQGIITDLEFTAKKTELLSRL